MACLYPGARDVQAFWRNILNGVDAVTDPPAGAWDPERYYEPGSMETDRVYTKRGGYIEDFATFDPLPFGVPPKDVGGEPDQWLALKLARDALIDAGYADAAEEVRHRTAVILGRGLYPNSGSVNAVQHTLIVTQTLDVIRAIQPDLTDEDLEQIRKQLKDSLPKFGADTAPALTPNMITGRIANRLDLMGPNYTVDAACASSLVAMKMATRELLNGDCDLALAGGSQVWTSMPILGVFGQMGALSHSEQIRPFDKNADGTILGEGIAFLVLKRLADAERDHDRIYAVMRGVGIASDGRASGLMAPRVEGQVLAMRRAYESAGVDPQTISLIEAHGTGTPVGDHVEVQSMTQVFGPRRGPVPNVAMGTVKSMIGHTMPAAGAAGLIKASLSLYHKVLPPTLHCEEPNPELELEKTPFYINGATRPWVSGTSHPRRAAVSAFGFGGINGHVVLEEYVPQAADAENAEDDNGTAAYLPPWESELVVLTAASMEALAGRVSELVSELEAAEVAGNGESLLTIAGRLASQAQPTHMHRLAIVATSGDDLLEKARRARDKLSDPKTTRIREAAGVFYTSTPLAPEGKVAFLFPGEGSQYLGMMEELALHFPEARSAFDEMNAYHEAGDGPAPSHFLQPSWSATDDDLLASSRYLWTMDGAVTSVLGADEAMLRVLKSLGIKAEAVAGHSSGEYAALRTAGVFRAGAEDDFGSLASTLLKVHEASQKEDVIEPAVLMAFGGDREMVEGLLQKTGADGFVAMDNCMNQVVVVTRESSREALQSAAREQAMIVEVLNFDRPYHTKWFSAYSNRLRAALDESKFASPLSTIYSCATGAPVEPASSPAALADLVANQWSESVEFRRMIERMYEDGYRVFVEVGPGNHLTAFVEDILRGKKIAAYSSNLQQRSDLTQLNHMAGMLFVQGVNFDVQALTARRLVLQEASPATKRSITEVPLVTGFSSMTIDASKLSLRGRANGVSTASAQESMQAQTHEEPAGASVPEAHIENPAISSFEEESALSPQTSPPSVMPLSPPSHYGQDDLAGVTHRFLETMDHFLAVQERVLLAYLGAPASNDGAAYSSGSNGWHAIAPALYPNNNSAVPQLPLEATTYAPPPPPPPVYQEPASQPVSAPVVSTNGSNGNGSNGNGSTSHTAPVEEPVATSAPVATATASLDVVLPEALREIVSERTGYPPEVIDVNADLEADLGIDSIKRVEILGTLRSQQPALSEVNLEKLTVCRTLQQIVDVLVGEVGGRPFELTSVDAGSSAEGATTSTHPVLGRFTRFEPGLAATARLTVDPERAEWLRDHTIGRDVSMLDHSLLAVPVMPLALSLELLAQAGAALMPGHVVSRLEAIRARRWIEFGDGPRTLEVRVERRSDTPAHLHGEILLLGDGDAAVAVEAELILAPVHGERPEVQHALTDRTASLSAGELYDAVMYHGATWRGVASLHGTGEKSVAASLRVPDTLVFDAGQAPLHSHIDPIALDAAGQLLGFWTAERLESGRLVFPVSVECIEFFGPSSQAGEELTCHVSIAQVDERRVEASFDVVGDAGLQFRVTGWLDRRFDIPQVLEAVVRPGALPHLAEELSAETSGRSVCLRLQGERIEDETGTLRRIWASRIRHRTERERLGLTAGTPADLLQEHVAKEAVCRLLQREYGLSLLPADVALEEGSDGEVHGVGTWSSSLSASPAVWLGQVGYTMIAVASLEADAEASRAVVSRLVQATDVSAQAPRG